MAHLGLRAQLDVSSRRRANSQYKYSPETFSYKDDLRGGEYLINIFKA